MGLTSFLKDYVKGDVPYPEEGFSGMLLGLQSLLVEVAFVRLCLSDDYRGRASEHSVSACCPPLLSCCQGRLWPFTEEGCCCLFWSRGPKLRLTPGSLAGLVKTQIAGYPFLPPECEI